MAAKGRAALCQGYGGTAFAAMTPPLRGGSRLQEGAA